MKLSNANSQKLTQIVWRERARKIALIAGAGVAVIGAAAAISYNRSQHGDPAVAYNLVHAVVEGKSTSPQAARGYVFHARLADGTEKDVLSPNRTVLAQGAHVVLMETTHKSGAKSYELNKIE